MKRLTALILALLMVVCLASCGQDSKSDYDYVKSQGKLVVGITDFAPMDYQESGSKEWIGFDADMAKAFAKELGVDVEFVVIEWGNKVLELENKNIDCVWNGMTLTEGIKKSMETTKAYCINSQIVVVPADEADKYKTVDDIKDLKFAAEGGSAGEEVLTDLGYDVTPVETQAYALSEVAAGTSDACVIDSLMAAAMIGEGTDYKDLVTTVKLNSEEYGVGFRKGSDLAAKLDEFFDKSYKDGTIKKIATKYGVQAALIEQ